MFMRGEEILSGAQRVHGKYNSYVNYKSRCKVLFIMSF